MARSDYSARHLSVLEGLEAVRKRPGMYVGSTDSRGLMHCLWEIIDNAVDEALGGHGSDIEIILHEDSSIEVRDRGRGIPVDIEPKTGLSGVEVVFTKLHAGGKFGSGSYASSGGLHGVGASVVNALSQRLDVEVDRDGKTWAMSFCRGEPGVFEQQGDTLSADDPFTAFTDESYMRVVAEDIKPLLTGTRVRYWADRQVFSEKSLFDRAGLLERARQTAFLVPGLNITIDDHTDPDVEPVSFCYEGGITEFVDFLASDTPVTDVWRMQGEASFRETVPLLNDEGQLVSTEVERVCQVDIALRWGIGYDTTLRSFANIISTPHGGSHVSGFEQAMVKFFRKQVESASRKLKAGTHRPEKDDILAGMTAIVSVRLPEPQFEGQTKEILGTPAVRAIVSQVVMTELGNRFSSSKRDDKTQATLLLDKIVAEMKSRIAARAHKETQRRKNALETSSLPAKLVDCRTHNIENSELFIVEGDSALGTARRARQSEFQALLPIRGKILNVQKASVSDMLSNSECTSILQVVGAGSGRSFDLEAARYGKIIIMSDADVDGAHIRTLLLTLFFRYMKPLIEEGRVFAAVPPLHRVVVLNPGSKPNDILYTYSEAELQRVLTDLEDQGKKYKEPIQRYKGLGEMDADQLANTTMDRTKRTLRRIRVEDAHKANEIFELLMGSDVAKRKEFIVAGAEGMQRSRIDI